MRKIERNSNKEIANTEMGEEAKCEAPHGDTMKQYLHDVKKRPLLSTHEERHMAEKVAKGDKNARHDMIVANLRLVVNLAKRYVNRGLHLQDLIEEGNIGLIKAVEKYKLSKGCKFSTYATYWIRQTIERSLINQSRIVRVPVHINTDLMRLLKARRELFSCLRREPEVKELAKNMGMAESYIKKLMLIDGKVLSLEATFSNDTEHSLLDFIEDENIPSPSDTFEEAKRANQINDWLDILNDSEKSIIRQRFGIDASPETLDSIGKKFGVTRERIRQIEVKAIKKLRLMISQRNIAPIDII